MTPYTVWTWSLLVGCTPLLPASDGPVDTFVPDDATGPTDTPAPTDTTDPICGPSVWASGTYDVEHAGRVRTVRVRLPSGYDPTVPAPMVVLFHGWGGGPEEFLDDPTVAREADARGYVLVAPEGLGREEGRPASWSFRGSTTGLDGDGRNDAVDGDSEAICEDAQTTDYTYPSCAGVAANGCSWTHCLDDDVDFVVSLVATSVQSLCIDAQRVYAVGGSNGGMFTWELGQNPVSAATFRAIAPIIGLPHRAHLGPPARAGGMPVLLVTGTRDRTVPPGAWDDPAYTTTSDGDVYHYTGATGIMRKWSEAMGCSTNAAAAPIAAATADVDCRTYCAAPSGVPPVVDCRLAMGHVYGLARTWPVILDFFDQNR